MQIYTKNFICYLSYLCNILLICAICVSMLKMLCVHYSAKAELSMSNNKNCPVSFNKPYYFHLHYWLSNGLNISLKKCSLFYPYPEGLKESQFPSPHHIVPASSVSIKIFKFCRLSISLGCFGFLQDNLMKHWFSPLYCEYRYNS